MISHPFINFLNHKPDSKNREMAFLSSSILALFFPLIFHHFLLDSQKMSVMHGQSCSRPLLSMSIVFLSPKNCSF